MCYSECVVIINCRKNSVWILQRLSALSKAKSFYGLGSHSSRYRLKSRYMINDDIDFFYLRDTRNINRIYIPIISVVLRDL